MKSHTLSVVSRNDRARHVGLHVWLSGAATRLWESAEAGDEATDLFMVTIRRGGEGPRYLLAAISPGETEARHGLWEGTDRDQLAGVLAGLLAPDVTQPPERATTIEVG